MFSRMMAKWRRGRSAKTQRQLRAAAEDVAVVACSEELEGRVLLSQVPVTVFLSELIEINSPDAGGAWQLLRLGADRRQGRQV